MPGGVVASAAATDMASGFIRGAAAGLEVVLDFHGTFLLLG
jgi:hypothetical protein